ncbi:30S ribosomal protein S4e, partial [Candidatus Bathyarchaeota archaeon]|nr:30S ribosomal protein S4e [Candidatus Bathyarchaeota archaeon]
MARKFGSRQLKREPSPRFWPINRKKMAWAPLTRPGPHAQEKSLPLVIVIREILGYANTAREARHIINTGKVKVDGKVRRDHRFPVGLMDVLQIEGASGSYRILPKADAGLTPTPIDPKEVGFKLCKVVGKKTIPGGSNQITLHDGRSLILPAREARQKTGEDIMVGATIQIGLPDQKIMSQVPFQMGALGLVVDGRNQGLTGRVESIIPGTHARRKTVRIETLGGTLETPAAYVIPIGTDKPLV